MKYMGSKDRHAKDILPFLMSKLPCAAYYEPFVGGANMIDKIHIYGDRFGSDIDEDLICVLDAASKGWLPPREFTEDQYRSIKTEPVSPLRGYAAFALSYGGKKFGGWCRDGQGKRNYVDEAYRNAIKQFPKLLGCKFECNPFWDCKIFDGSIVYCDPPYQGTTKYKNDFPHSDFWQWVRDISKRNSVFISEYAAPQDFKCIWEKPVNSSLTKDTGGKKNIERLFIYGENQ